MKRVLVFYSHFFPAFKAGGPVQSLMNFVQIMKNDFQLFIVCSARDLGDTTILAGIAPDAWNEYDKNVSVYYAERSVWKAVKKSFLESRPDVVYINGMFLPGYNWLPLWYAKSRGTKVIVAPRGMLQKGALASKSLKKKIFLKLLQMSGLCKNICWHATDAQEQADIKQIFGKDSSVNVAFNIPRAPYSVEAFREKTTSHLKMVYLSLIAEKKNLHVILNALKKIQQPIEFDIYGPVKDQPYWERCMQLMKHQIHRINYGGAVSPADVQDVLSGYHLLVLPTKGENFGHAIYDALSVGTPVAISKFTPWGDVGTIQAGVTVDSEDLDLWAAAIQQFIDIDQENFSAYSKGAHQLALDYFHHNDFKSQYLKLFNF